MDNINRFWVNGLLQDIDSAPPNQVYIRVPKAGRLVRVQIGNVDVISGTNAVIAKNATKSVTVAGLSVGHSGTTLIGLVAQDRPDGDTTAVFEAGDVLELESDGGATVGGEAHVQAEFQAGSG